MDKEIGKINKNDTTDIVLRIDDFGGRRGLTIREFITSERYTGFTKAGVRILAENFPKFKAMVNSINEKEMAEPVENLNENSDENSSEEEVEVKKIGGVKRNENLPDY